MLAPVARLERPVWMAEAVSTTAGHVSADCQPTVSTAQSAGPHWLQHPGDPGNTGRLGITGYLGAKSHRAYKIPVRLGAMSVIQSTQVVAVPSTREVARRLCRRKRKRCEMKQQKGGSILVGAASAPDLRPAPPAQWTGRMTITRAARVRGCPTPSGPQSAALWPLLIWRPCLA